MRPILVLVALSYVLVFASCSTSQEVVLDLGSSVDLSVEVSLEPYFASYLLDLSGGRGQVFDIPRLRASLTSLGVEVREIISSSNTHISMKLRAPDLIRTAEEKIGQNFISWNPGARPSELRLSLGPESIRKMLGVSGLVKEEGLHYLLPEPGSSRGLYKDDLVWIFEEYLDADSVLHSLEASEILLKILTPRPVSFVSGDGFRKIGERQLELRLNVLDFLLLDQEQVYLLRY